MTARLMVREMTLNDLDFIATMLADPDVMRFYPKRYDRVESVEWIRKQQERYGHDGCGVWLVERRANQVPVGQAGLVRVMIEDAQELAIAYLIHRPYWQQGFATELAVALQRYAFSTHGVQRVITLIRPENGRSLSVARRSGMREERKVTWAGYDHLIFSTTSLDTNQTPSTT